METNGIFTQLFDSIEDLEDYAIEHGVTILGIRFEGIFERYERVREMTPDYQEPENELGR